MIEKMKRVLIVSRESHKRELLDTLRDLGILHLSEKESADEGLLERFSTISRLLLELKDYLPDGEQDAQLLSDREFNALYEKTVAALKRKAVLADTKATLAVEADRIRAWGDFDPTEVRALRDAGVDFRFYRMDKKELKRLSQNDAVRYIRLSSVDKMETVAILGTPDPTVTATEFALPEKGLSQLKAEAESCDREIETCVAVLKESAAKLNSYSAQLIKTQNDAEYSSVDRTLGTEDGLVWISGYIPETETGKFTEAAKEHSWAWQMDDVDENDPGVPTKIRYNKLTALMKPIFEILGTVPGYGEYDISFWFLAFFTLFFAMIIGDAGYGALFLVGTAAVTLKMKKTTNATLLLFVLSAATVVWGAMTGTWFGLEGAMKVPFLKALVVPQFANYPEYFNVSTTSAQNSVMKFCFSIGVIQLALACIMSVRRKIAKKDLSWLCDFGWLIAICALYFTVLYLVIGQRINVTMVAAAVGLGFIMVVLFGGMSPDKSFSAGLKAGLGDTFTVFLNTISAFGNIMSYIRLFAVGMASLAIAQSFNDMAAGFKGPLLVVGAIIMIIGHLLNIVMGFLSVVVHGVRLNLLEFSGQLGMEWSGTAYDPFRKTEKLKK